MVLESPAAFRVGSVPPPSLSPEQMVKAFRRHPDREPAWTGPDPERMGRAWPIVERVLVSTPEYDEALTARMAESDVRTLVLFGEFDGVIPPENGRTYRRFMKQLVAAVRARCRARHPGRSSRGVRRRRRRLPARGAWRSSCPTRTR